MRTVYLSVAGRIRRELSELDGVMARIEGIWKQRSETPEIGSNDYLNDYLIDAIALNLHGFYAGIERLLEVIADGIDQTKPSVSLES